MKTNKTESKPLSSQISESGRRHENKLLQCGAVKWEVSGGQTRGFTERWGWGN